ncbi:MAG: exonuclease SbcCD subunit D C-terminal domain-containing protein [Pseudomonadota bacterium]
MLRLIHTADWHLGHTLHGVSRAYEHQCFLDWLLDTLHSNAVDALLLTGDIFDSTNPPASAQAMFYDFLAQARRRCPELDIVIVAGNHDSPARLAAPSPLLTSMNIHITGLLPRTLTGDIEADKVITPLTNAQGEVAAWCVASPFLRPADLIAPEDETDDPLIAGVRQVYAELLNAGRARLTEGQALVVTGHCYMTGGELSELSERKILGGNQHALPVDIFSDDITYVALGHLHLAQAIGKRDNVRYSGAPLALSISENNYPHQVMQLDIEDNQVERFEALRTPCVVKILRLPEGDPQPLDDVLEALADLALDDVPPEQQPLLEVRVALESPVAGLRSQIEAVLEDKPIRLLKITPHYTGSGESLADAKPRQLLQSLDPEDVFVRRYQRDHQDSPDAELLSAFHELLEGLDAD